MFSIFETDLSHVSDILNIDENACLVAMQNRLYLLYQGDISDAAAEIPTPDPEPEITNQNDNKNIVVTVPNGGEIYELGSDLTIQWTSTKGLNDIIRIDLYKNDEAFLVIADQASNTGAYVWSIPLSLEVGEYKIKLTWLSATQEVASENEDLSDKVFAIVVTKPIVPTPVTPTGTTETDKPYWAIPILELNDGENITGLFKDSAFGNVLLTTSEGRILGQSMAETNAYLTGKRNIYLNVIDGKGFKSNDAYREFLYALYRQVAKINEDKEIINNTYVVQPSAIEADLLTGVFVSPILDTNGDLAFYKELTWYETKPTGTDIVIDLRAADTTEELLRSSWSYSFSSLSTETSPITRDLQATMIKGKYIQARATIKTYSIYEPILISLNIKYSTFTSSYFFTTKFKLEDVAKRGFLVANITEPVNTEVRFGITDKNSADWQDYKPVEMGEFFDIQDYNRLKVGIKFISYGNNLPIVSEFALITGSNTAGIISSTGI
jgi:hypothetical protein